MSETQPISAERLKITIQEALSPEIVLFENDSQLQLDLAFLFEEFVDARQYGIPATVFLEIVQEVVTEYEYSPEVLQLITRGLISKEAEAQVRELISSHIKHEIRKLIVSAYKELIPQIEQKIISFDQAVNSLVNGFNTVLEADIQNELIIEILIEEGLLE